MNIERLKSTLLTILVLVSILLTWKLWSYEPTYQFITEDPQYLSDISIGKKLDVTDVFQPTKLIFHLEDNNYGTEKTSKIASIYQNMQTWNIQSLRLLPKQITNLNGLSAINQSVEVIFPSPLPADIVRSIFNVSEDAINLEGVDRVVISANLNTEKDETVIYFISYPEQKVVQAEITNIRFTSIIENYLLDAHVETPYTKFLIKSPSSFGKIIYVPDEKTKIKAVTYTASTLKAEDQFKEVLFSNPDFVKKTRTGMQEETYTDGRRALEIFHEKSVMKYINPLQKHRDNEMGNQFIRQSYDFVNAHSGWTDKYLYYQRNSDKEAVTFRKFINNYPVFAYSQGSNHDLATIYVSWRDGQVYEYIRSLINMQRELIENREVVLASGSQIIDHLYYLEEMHEFNFRLLKDITIGFQMNKINTNLITLNPSWFIHYNGEWLPINYPSQTSEGESGNGLE